VAGAEGATWLTTPGKTAVAAATAPTVAAPENRERRERVEVLEDIEHSGKKSQGKLKKAISCKHLHKSGWYVPMFRSSR
jgi:hypothetical protein